MSARRIDCTQVRTGGHTGPPLRWELPPHRAVYPKRSRLSFRNEKKLRILLAYELRKQRVTRHIELCAPTNRYSHHRYSYHFDTTLGTLVPLGALVIVVSLDRSVAMIQQSG